MVTNYESRFASSYLAAEILFKLEAKCPIIKFDEENERAQDCICENEPVGDCIECVNEWLQEECDE